MHVRTPLLLAFALAGQGLCPVPGAAQQTAMALAQKSNIVFVGTVVRVAAASFAGVPATPRTLVVHVDAVLDKPQAVRLAVGDSVTVETRTDSAWQTGARATFYATGWILGRGVAVREVAHEIMPAQMSAADLARQRNAYLQVQRQVSDSALRARARAADMIVVGRVETIRAPTLMPQSRRRITEHDPDWQEAVIAVDTMLKGAVAQRVVVRFPASLDIAWHALPKFTAGETGTFLLQRDSLSGAPQAVMAGRQVPAYVAARREDVLSAADAQRVRALLAP